MADLSAGTGDATYWDTAHQTAAGKVEEFKDQADLFSSLTQSALANLESSAITFNDLTYNLSISTGGYTEPDTPVEPDYSSLGPASPTLGSVGTVSAITPGSAPTEPTDPSGPTDPTISAPSAVAAIVPGTVPTVDEPSAISAVDPGTDVDTSLDLADEPDDLALSFTLPAAFEGLTLPTFSGTEVEADVGELVATYSYVEPTYIDQLKDETKAVLSSVLGGSLVISTAVWDAIWDRARADTALVQVAEEWAASNFAASTGMTGMVNETLLSRLDAAEQRASQRDSTTRIEQAIEEAKQRREDMWNSVGQAIAFETMWIQQAEGIAGRALASAAEAIRAAIGVHNSNVARFNAYVSKASQGVALGRLELDAALASLQEYKLTLERSDLELRALDLDLRKWLGEWEGWSTEKTTALGLIDANIKAYVSEWQSDQARHASSVAYEQLKLDKDKTAISAFGIDINGQAARHAGDVAYEQLKFQKTAQDLSLFSAQWQGIATQASYIASILNARVNSSNFELQQKVAVTDAEAKSADVSIKTNQQLLDEFKIGWDGVQIQKSAESSILDSRTRLYGSQVQGEGIKVQYDNLSFQEAAKDADQTLAASVQKATLGVQQALGNLQYLANTSVGLTQAYCAAADVAVNSSASAGYNYSSGSSYSESDQRQVTWSGDCSNEDSCPGVT